MLIERWLTKEDEVIMINPLPLTSTTAEFTSAAVGSCQRVKKIGVDEYLLEIHR